jgi:hypothetical protein
MRLKQSRLLENEVPMATIIVHRFQVWDVTSDQMRTSSRLATVEAIKNIAHGEPMGPPIEIDASELSGEIEGMTARNYTPISQRAAQAGQFQTRVPK